MAKEFIPSTPLRTLPPFSPLPQFKSIWASLYKRGQDIPGIFTEHGIAKYSKVQALMGVWGLSLFLSLLGILFLLLGCFFLSEYEGLFPATLAKEIVL